MIIGRRSLTPLFVASPNVRDTQVEKTIHSVGIGRCFENDLRLVGSRATSGVENIHVLVSQLYVTGIFGLHHFPAKNADIEFL